MTKKHNSCCGKRLCAFVLAAALSCTLGGCARKDPEIPRRPKRGESTATLPDLDKYRREAEQLRSEQAAQTQTDVLPEETSVEDMTEAGELPDSEAYDTALDELENEDWKEGLSFPSATLAPLESEVTEESAVTAAPETSAETAAQTSTETAAVTQTSSGAETISVSPAAAENAALGMSGEVSGEYDKEFFSSDLFIGDSISTGYSLYGFMDDKNVFAKIGLNPSSVLTKSVPTVYGEITAETMISYTLPKRVYIMLGSNGIQWLSGESMLKSMKSLTDMIKEKSPETMIVIVGVPPVTAAYDSTVEGMNVMAAVNDYNSGLSKFAAENSCIFVDPGDILKDNTGYFAGAYAEGDGMHFKAATYKLLLNYLQREVTAAEERAAAMAAEEETEDDSLTPTGERVPPIDIGEFAENANVDGAVKNAVTGFPEEFVTLPEAVSAKAEAMTETAKPEKMRKAAE